ncbi:flagellar filament capping protein FliD [Pallidibacillus pasinlerensis]|uniref:Flagellar hook-associated protein 2 n=1 Tax=Pallidibacillus pasinlerensis TaxID=2703818 RepID=A0ABW9ZZS9_9BACI|nr:flagellar filament capping protein FliD [Pallidibacillus pasinlerensis]NCU16681.1 flagellar filament capping protein FliD [Pallidibacillus pasinlerensis]
MVGVRVSGLASGMDIDTIVKDLMRAERMPLDKIEKEKTTLEWKRDAYREINTAIYGFYNDLLDFTLQRSYQTRSVTSSNEDFVTATAASGAGTGTYTISEVKQLAKAATMISLDRGISGEAKVDLTKSIHEIQDKFAENNFGWKSGVLDSNTIKIESETTNTVAFLKNGQERFTDDLSVKINGKGITVFSEKPTSTENLNITENYAWIEDGQLVFNSPLKKNDVVEVDYVVEFKEETRKLTKDQNGTIQKTIQIGGALNREFENILTIDGTTYRFVPSEHDPNEGKIVPNGGADSDSVGTINFETGLISFGDEFLSEKFTGDTKELEIEIKYQQRYFSFDATTHTSEGIRHENFLVRGDRSLNDVFKEVNNSSLGLMMFYDNYTDQVTITRTETGVFNPEGDIELNGGFFTDVLGFSFSEGEGSEGAATYNAGQNAIFTINGLETQRTSNTFNVNGVSFTLKNIFDAADGVQPVTLSVNNDSEKLFESIKGFVDKYNEIVGKIEEKLNEPYYKGYAPLSDLEREELTDKQQEKWEEMARSGLLRRDPILSSMITQMRSALFSAVNNNELNPQRTSLSSIGINTTSDFRSAKLEINETRLREAIENDPESVELLFRSGDSNSTFGEKGVVRRLRDILQGTRDRIQARAGNANMTEHQYTIGRQIANFEDRIERFEQRLQRLEDRYYRQFTLMEKAIMQSNNQMMQLSQFFM